MDEKSGSFVDEDSSNEMHVLCISIMVELMRFQTIQQYDYGKIVSLFLDRLKPRLVIIH